jgi:hypothetical protein
MWLVDSHPVRLSEVVYSKKMNFYFKEGTLQLHYNNQLLKFFTKKIALYSKFYMKRNKKLCDRNVGIYY